MLVRIFLILITLLSFWFTQAQGGSNMTNTKTFVVSMGCFWCGESEFRDHESLELKKGIVDIKVGYASDGTTKTSTDKPTYKNHEGYRESVKITYDPTQISYEQLLEIFWKNIDPFDDIGQFCDKGSSYTAAIFYNDEEEKQKAFEYLEKTKEKLQHNKKVHNLEIKTQIVPYKNFFDAEEYHQNYKAKNPIRYRFYRWNCGRDQRLQELWGNK